jgi:DNA-directed RNA polymerase specialized sigma24 family protein
MGCYTSTRECEMASSKNPGGEPRKLSRAEKSKLYETIVRYVQLLLRNKNDDDVHDIAHEVLVALLEKPDQLPSDETRLDGYVRRKIVSSIKKNFGKHPTQFLNLGSLSNFLADVDADESELAGIDVLAAIRTLDSNDQALFKMIMANNSE